MCFGCNVEAEFEEAVDCVSAPVPCLGVEESGVDEPLGDPFVPHTGRTGILEQLLALEASKV
jgi:hypothetical protein